MNSATHRESSPSSPSSSISSTATARRGEERERERERERVTGIVVACFGSRGYGQDVRVGRDYMDIYFLLLYTHSLASVVFNYTCKS